jgi:hypothetical protein
MAAALGVSKSQVSRDAQAGMPMHDVAAAITWRQAQHDFSRTADGRIDRTPPLDAPPAAPGAADDGDDDAPASDPDTAAFRSARAARERTNAERAQLELDQLRGNLIPLADAQRLAFTVFRTLRDAVLNVPARVKDQAAAMTDPLLVERLIEDELTATLRRFDETSLVTEPADDDDETG